jgi:hypothetical protein
VRDVTVRGQSFIDNGLSTRFDTHVPQRRDEWDKGFKDRVYHIDTQFLYQHGHMLEKGGRYWIVRVLDLGDFGCRWFNQLWRMTEPRPDLENICGHDTGGIRVMLGEV